MPELPALLNCPFCGLRKTKIQEAGVKEWAVYCKNDRCQAYGPVGITKAQACRRWNTRPRHRRAERKGQR